jgi:hypothetical protein
MPVLLSTAEMAELAQKLAKMKINRARNHIRRLDRNGKIELYRDSVGYNRWLTRYALPNKGLWITLVEEKEDYGPPSDLGYRKTRFKYLEAIVEPLPAYAYNDNPGNVADRTWPT